MLHKFDSPSQPITRVQRNILAAAERRLLTWLCARMPMWVTPDLLTAVGMAGAAAVFAGYAASNWHVGWLWLAIGGFAVQWFGDSMDGSLARFRKIERPSFGYFIDHSCDGLANLLIMAGIGLSPFVRLDVALFALTGYLLLSIHAFLSVRVLGEMKLSYIAAGPTELRLMLIALTLAMMAVGTGARALSPVSGFDVVIGCAGAILLVLFLVQTLVASRRLLARGESD
ncbi:MAG: CDP-alcohol phosphatidyltransferase family protein [Pseudomonadota bacterium]|nr:CDP-alcohol phosphatidyltransferase family protein [Pseudomonadota bacterium]